MCGIWLREGMDGFAHGGQFLGILQEWKRLLKEGLRCCL